ncbi:MAG: hypothetical protein RR523_07485 [Cetobacterium sp.]|uniref:hypothetical protein n=1 Tax=Cetobacterium sp. TaxID=2071632 RepID=UPI002FC6D3D6
MEIIKKIALIYLILVSMGILGASTVVFIATLDIRNSIKNEKAWWLFIITSFICILLSGSGFTFGIKTLTGN